ncbi:MAG TPA: iron ABC transporter permease [Acidimicrobiales bacterium]|nr:iron ABC transporter permease [Acidimicrobiales bacterium]
MRRGLLAAGPALFLAVFFVWPVATILAEGLDRSTLSRVATDGGLWQVLWFTTWQAAISTAATVVVGVPTAFVFARYRFPGRRMMWAALVVPFVLPTVVVGVAFRTLLGRGGPLAGLGIDQHVAAIVLAHLFFNLAVVVRTVGSAWAHVPRSLEEAAASLGAGPARVFREVTLPAIRPALASAAVVVFLFCFTSFGVVLLLGPPGTSTLEVEIYRQTAHLLDLPTASALAAVQLVATSALLATYLALDARRRRVPALAAAERRAPRGRAVPMVAGVIAFTALLLGAPLVSLVVRSFSVGPGWGLAWYRSLVSGAGASTRDIDLVATFGRSVACGLAATGLALALGGAATAVLARGRARLLDLAVMIPLGTSAVTLGFGFLLALDTPPLDLRGRWVLVPIAQGLVALPFVVRVLLPATRAVDPRLRQSAAVLGAAPRRVWREVDLPLLSGAARVAAAFAFAVSLGEFGATVFIARPESTTMPIAIARSLARPGPANLGAAMAMSTVLMVVTVAAVALVDRRSASTVAGF